MEDFETKGYMVVRGRLSPDTIALGQSCIRGDKVNYTMMSAFVENNMLAALNKEMGSGWNIQYSKYRVSDNNNSDAATFHRDSVCLGEWVPVLTCLTYLDKTTMEVIPGSHKIQAASLLETPGIFASRERVSLEPGDLLIFHSTMLHRGILTDAATAHRRLIQVFECFKNPEEFEKFSKRLIHITGDEKSASGFSTITKVPGVRDLSNMASYLNMITGCGGKNSLYLLDKCGIKDTGRDVFCSEGFCKRIRVEPNSWQQINTYIIKDQAHFDLPEKCKADWKWAMYNRQFLLFTLAFLAVLASIVTGLYFVVRAVLFKTTKARKTGGSARRAATRRR